MRCSGIYVFNKQEIVCEKRWGCARFAIKAKPKRETPKMKTEGCDLFKPTPKVRHDLGDYYDMMWETP